MRTVRVARTLIGAAGLAFAQPMDILVTIDHTQSDLRRAQNFEQQTGQGRVPV